MDVAGKPVATGWPERGAMRVRVPIDCGGLIVEARCVVDVSPSRRARATACTDERRARHRLPSALVRHPVATVCTTRDY